MNAPDLLAEKIAGLERARQRVSENRNQWTTVLKPLLLQELTSLLEAFPIGWSLSHGDSAWTNLDHVSLSFDTVPSGIVEINTQQPVSKQGGGLFFGQSVNGKVTVMLVYPAVKDFAKPSPSKQVGSFEPDEFNPAFINRIVIQFLEEMIEWEETGERSLPQIGFRH